MNTKNRPLCFPVFYAQEKISKIGRRFREAKNGSIKILKAQHKFDIKVKKLGIKFNLVVTIPNIIIQLLVDAIREYKQVEAN